MVFLRSGGLLAAAVAAHACLLVRAHNPFGSLAQAPVPPMGAGLHAWPASLPLSGLSRTLGAISPGLGRISDSEFGVEPQKQQMLKHSSSLIEQAQFAEAKAVLANCVELSPGVPQEVEAQVQLLRWRMGLPQLGPHEVAAWLGDKGASKKPLADGLVADSSLGKAFSRLARVVAGSETAHQAAAISAAVDSATTEAAFVATDSVETATAAGEMFPDLALEHIPLEFAGTCLHAILAIATCASLSVLIARVWAVGLSIFPQWQTPLVSMAARDHLQRFWRILNVVAVCAALHTAVMAALVLLKNLCGRLQKKVAPNQESLSMEPIGLPDVSSEGGPSTCTSTCTNGENSEDALLKFSETAPLERCMDEASSTLVQLCLPEVPDESSSESEMPELEQMGLEGLEREDFEDGLQDTFSECSEPNVDGYGMPGSEDAIKTVLLSPDKLGFEACTGADFAKIPSTAQVEEASCAKKESLLCGSVDIGLQGSVRRVWGRRLNQTLDSKDQPELSEAFVFASDDCLSEAPSEAPQNTCQGNFLPAPIVTLPRCLPSDTCFLDSVDKSDHAVAVQIRALSQEAFGKGEDAMQLRRGERVAALLVSGEVVSYASYVVRRDLASFSVNKLAVAQSHRRRGLGRIMLRNLIQMSKRRARGEAPLDVVCLSSLPTSVDFYKACAFHESSIKPSFAEHVVEGQVYMEYCLQRKRNK